MENRQIVKKVLADHLSWLESQGKEGEMADLTRANLFGADLTGFNLAKAILFEANLFEADLTGANLSGADLTEANLENANLERADLTEANLENANLTDACLIKANLVKANLTWANLSGANLFGANLSRANLPEANLTGAKLPNYQIPQNVSLIGYKKVIDNFKNFCILKLEIPPEAKRTANLTSNKCRAEFAKVIGWRLPSEIVFSTESRKFISFYTSIFIYKVGEIATPDSYDPDIRLECTNGLHFFLNESDAVAYDI